MGKKTLPLVLCLLLLAAIPVTAMGYTTPAGRLLVAQPRMSYIDTADISLTISSTGRASVWADAYGIDGATTRMTIVATIEQYHNNRWTTVYTAPTATGTLSATVNRSYTVTTGYTYRAKAVIKANNGAETETIYSTEEDY